MGILDGPFQSPALEPPKPPAMPEMPSLTAPKRRGFGDAPATRKRVFDNVLNAAKTMPPAKNALYTLKLDDVDYVDPDEVSLSDQKNAILSGNTVARRMKGTWSLIDNTSGETLDKKTSTIARVPYFTDRGTFIHNGNEYTLANQMRLRAGIFTRQKDNGEIEAHVNVLPGKGFSHRYYLDPTKGTFHMRIGQAKLPLMPLLRAMGAQDAQLREAWGGDARANELLAANYAQDDPVGLNKLYLKLVRGKQDHPDLGSRTQALAEAVSSMELDPEVTKRTLGQPFKNLDLQSILTTTKKLLDVSRGDAEVDDRDHLAYQTVVGPEDLISERLFKDAGRLRHTLLYKAAQKKNLRNIQPGALDKQITSAILHSGLGQALEEINTAEIFDKQSRISRLGEGGIPSLDAVPEEARAVQPSHLGFIDPLRTPESFRAGVDVNLSNSVEKGDDGRIYAPFTDVRTGQTVYRSPQDVADLAIAFPNQMNNPGKRVIAMQGGRLRYVPKDQVSLVVPHFENAFSTLGNMVPMKSAVKGQRVAMASRMLTQALPLKDPEAPLVQSGVPGMPGRSFEEEYSKHMGAVHADQGGFVEAVTPDEITMRYDDGTVKKHQLYNNFPYNRKTYAHNTVTVQPGARLEKGGLLAHSNFTDKHGVTALGKNFNVAYIPFRGMNFEDALVISESTARALSSEHMYQQGLDFEDKIKTGKKPYLGMFPSKFDRATLDTMDDDGVVKPGTIINFGHPLVLAAKQRDTALNKIHRRNEPGYADHSQVWNHHSPGIVTDVVKTKHGTVVLVKSTSAMQIGDKMSGRYGDKGVISEIVPDHQMPQNAAGEPFHVLLNPLGIISRTNPAQMVEAALGKIAAKTGQPYKVPDFADIPDLTRYAIAELAKHGMKDTEDVIDPASGQKIPGIMTGNRFFMKLHHTAEGKAQGRGTGGYTQAGEPAKGGETGSKRISLLDVNAILSHGATAVLKDAGAVRGQKNEEFWLPFLQGHTPGKPKVPMIYHKFVNELRGSGINVVEDGNKTHIMALTDADVDQLAGGREIGHGDTVRLDKGLEPVPGGLFDPATTGGHHGNKWAAISLHEPMPNPVMEEPIRRLLGLTGQQFEDVLAGRRQLQFGTGPEGLLKTLQHMNIDKEIETARAQIKGTRKTLRDEAKRKLGYLVSAKQLNVHPAQWMLKRAPVLPPAFRPISIMSGGSQLPLVTDANYLYKELIDANTNLKDMSKEVDDVGEERLAVYNAFKAVTGLGDPIHPKLVEKNVQGLLKKIFGSSPKLGIVQRRLISSTTDLVGRSVITPDPDLDMDHVGLPESKAWEIYKNFIARRLRRRGLPLVEALKHVENHSPLARAAMVEEMEERPVIINRAPVLHRFGIQAFYPRLTKGDTLRVSPQIVKGFGADFDGDAMQYHVPVLESARKEAIERMLPSRNLFSPADFKTAVHTPSQEYVGGLYALTTLLNDKIRPRTFATVQDALGAARRGEIGPDTRVEILQ